MSEKSRGIKMDMKGKTDCNLFHVSCHNFTGAAGGNRVVLSLVTVVHQLSLSRNFSYMRKAPLVYECEEELCLVFSYYKRK
jgi:hypothetical protein